MIFRNSREEEFDGIKEVVERIEKHANDNPYVDFHLGVGTDSQINGRNTIYITAIALIGGSRNIFFITKHKEKRQGMHQRLFKETEQTLDIVRQLGEAGIERITPIHDIIPHLDMGHGGRSREVLDACVGWVRGMGMEPVIKPDAFIATHLADHFTH